MSIFDTPDPTGTDPNEQDPLLFRGKSPVLGQQVEVRTSGALPGEFPSAGPGAPPTAPTAPNFGAPPTPPNFGEFPSFSFEGGEPPEWTGGGLGDRPTGGTGPSTATPPWWAGVLEGLGVGQKAVSAGRRLANQGQGAAGETPTVPWAQPGAFDLSGFTGKGEPVPSLFGVEGQDVLDPTDFHLLDPSDMHLNLPAMTDTGAPVPGGGPNFLGAALPGLQLGSGIYGAVTQPPGSPGQVVSTANAVGGAAGTAAALAPEMFGALGGISGAAGLATLPIIVGNILKQFVGHPAVPFPKGYTQLPDSPRGRGARAVDPATGRVLEYKGGGQYEWSAETLKGQRFKPEDFVKYGIDPSGDLLKDPTYAATTKQIRDADVARGGAAYDPYNRRQAHEQSKLEELRQPDIETIQKEQPGASPGQWWKTYSTDPRFEADRAREQGLRDFWAPPDQERGNQ